MTTVEKISMRVSSRKNRCLKALLVLLCASTSQASDFISYDAKYRIDFLSRLAYHAFDPGNPASHRHTFVAEQELKSGQHWSANLGVRAYVEGVFATDKHYDAPVRQNESSEIALGDAFVQYRAGFARLRFGNQQVAWGEAFGAYYADIVNPKDMRESALGDLASLRIPVPMANALFFMGDSTVQFLAIPQPYFNKTASLGSDFSMPFPRFFPPGTALSLNDNRSLPLSASNGEVGMRVTSLIAGFDLALFGLYYHDRFPSYHMNVTNVQPLAIELQADHPRIASVGFTGSKDFTPVVVRWESVYTTGKLFDAVQNGVYLNRPSDEVTGVLGADYNGFESARFGVQTSRIYRIANIDGAIYPQSRDLVGVHLNATLWNSPVVDAVLSYTPTDGSSLGQLRLTLPLSHQFDMTLGADIFLGNGNSQFGLFRNASRGYVTLHGYFNG